MSELITADISTNPYYPDWQNLPDTADTYKLLIKLERQRVDDIYGRCSQDACKSIQLRLDSWSRMVELHGMSTVSPARLTTSPADIVPAVWADTLFEIQREKDRALYTGRQETTEHGPWFKDPQPLAFDIDSALKSESTETIAGENGVSLAEVWADPLARTLWIAVKARHITSQYFRGNCLRQARGIRQRPPKTANDLHIGTGICDNALGGSLGFGFQAEIHPWIVRVLIDEDNWPFLMPARSYLPDHQLGYLSKWNDATT